MPEGLKPLRSGRVAPAGIASVLLDATRLDAIFTDHLTLDRAVLITLAVSLYVNREHTTR